MSRRLLPVAALLALVAGCHGTPAAPETPMSSPTVASVDGPVAFHVRLGAGQRLTTQTPGADGCPAVAVTVTLGQGRLVRLVAFATTCEAIGDNARPGNGRHGVFRTADDIPAQRRDGASTVQTALGTATIFTQPYFECTNSCKNFTEPVAVIALDHPADPGVKALTAVAEKGAVDRDALTALLRDQLTA
ncbi:hypothetical protein AB0M46_32235 [Dactylosporangium sp. NPDC051485]|uniref:hypothetical protein n=1 Tax=Dactylosporangium sp. NPDC051485 TaxID=3154846 RepID=UPI0034389D3B